MKRLGLGFEIFLAVVAVALGAVLTVGLITRRVIDTQIGDYLARMPGTAQRPRMMGRAILGAAEQGLVAGVNRGVLIGALIAAVVAGVAAYLIARYLTRPLRQLEDAAEGLAAGDLAHRVDAVGPAEVAALGEAFNRMADSLEEAEELRKRLVADVAHELRNPIAAIRAQVEGMAEGILPVDNPRLESLKDDVSHLSALVDDLQDLAVADAGRLMYAMSPVALAELAAKDTARAAASAPPAVRVSIGALDADVVVLADEIRLSEVLRNLLANALKHTAEGRITVDVRRVGGQVEVRVTDTGEGIPEADLPYVFERFYRADRARAAHTGGAGLGLAISRRIVEDHGGAVFAENTPGGGASVGFTLPLA